MSCFSVNGTGSFTLKLDESFVPVKTIFGFTLFSNDHLSFWPRDLAIEQPFLPAYGEMSVRLLVTPFSFSFIPKNVPLVYSTFSVHS